MAFIVLCEGEPTSILPFPGFKGGVLCPLDDSAAIFQDEDGAYAAIGRSVAMRTPYGIAGGAYKVVPAQSVGGH
jgi:hypothetical protein